MPLIATDTPRLSHLVKHEYEASMGFCREAVTGSNATATTWLVGTVLGKITATGKYIVAKETAVDGSKVPAAVVIEEKTLAAATDTKVLTIARGAAILSKGALILDATYNDATKLAAAYAALEAKNILINETI